MNRIYLTAPLALGCALGACSGSDETTIPDALVASTLEAAGTNCEFGGTALAFGLDDNGDGVLQDAEVDSRSYVCDGATPDPVDAPPPRSSRPPRSRPAPTARSAASPYRRASTSTETAPSMLPRSRPPRTSAPPSSRIRASRPSPASQTSPRA